MKSAQQALAIESTDTASYEDSSKDQKKSLIIIRNYVITLPHLSSSLMLTCISSFIR